MDVKGFSQRTIVFIHNPPKLSFLPLELNSLLDCSKWSYQTESALSPKSEKCEKYSNGRGRFDTIRHMLYSQTNEVPNRRLLGWLTKRSMDQGMSIETLSTYLCVSPRIYGPCSCDYVSLSELSASIKSFNLNQLMILKISETRFVNGWLWLMLAMNFKATDVSSVSQSSI